MTETEEDMTCPWDYQCQNFESEGIVGEQESESNWSNSEEIVGEEESESNWSEGSIVIDSSLQRPGGKLLRLFFLTNSCS